MHPEISTDRLVPNPVPELDADGERTTRQTLLAMLLLLGYQGYVVGISGVAAPFIARSFGLGDAGIATMYAWISLSAIGALILSRWADRVGRRRVLVLCMTATPLAAVAAALAPTRTLFTLCAMVLNAFIGATMSGSVVMLAEQLPIAQRARGQSWGGLAIGFGAGFSVLGMPALEAAGYSWRWLLAVAGLGILLLPLVYRIVPESIRWQRATANGATERGGFFRVFDPRHRKRAVPVLICALFGNVATTASNNWTFYHAEAVVGLSAAVASAIVATSGAVGMAGFPLAAWSCERFGRVPTVSAASVLLAMSSLTFYWGPPVGFLWPMAWLGVANLWFTVATSVAMVGNNAAITELFPTAIRNTMVGWFALVAAVGNVSGQALIALLALPLGGLSTVVGYLALLAVPSGLIFAFFVDETRGLSLEAATGEGCGVG